MTMLISAYKLDADGQCSSSVFTKAETCEYLYPEDHTFDPDFDAPLNPEYRPNYDINLSNANAIGILEMLGYSQDDRSDDTFSVLPKEIIERCEAYLGRHKNDDNAYALEKINLILHMAREGLFRGATEIVAI